MHRFSGTLRAVLAAAVDVQHTAVLTTACSPCLPQWTSPVALPQQGETLIIF